MDQEFDDLENHVKQRMVSKFEILNDFMSASDNYARLLRISNKKPVSIAKDAREFYLEEPLYVRRFEIFSTELDKSLKGLEITVWTEAGDPKILGGHKVTTKKADGTEQHYLQYLVKGFVKKVTVRCSLPFRKLSILKVTAIGYSLDQLEAIAKDVSQSYETLVAVEKYVEEKKKAADLAKNKIEEAGDEIDNLTESVKGLEAQKTALVKSIESAKKDEKIEQEKVAKAKAALQLAENGYQSVNNNKTQLDEQISGLNKDVSNKKRELQDLVNDRNLISDEYRDYVAEGKKQSKNYLIFLIFPLIIIGFCSWQLYSGASNILQTDVTDLAHLSAMFFQRIPFATAIALVVAVCWKLSSALIRRIMLIHEQRLTLAKLLVIAKDTVYSSAVGLDLSDEERLRHRMLLKLDMLKSHLTNELGRDFEYRLAADSEDSKPIGIEAKK